MCSSDEDPLGAVRLAADALGEASRHAPPAVPAAVQALRAVLAAAEEARGGPRSTPFAWRGGGLQVASPAQRAARLAEWSAEVGVGACAAVAARRPRATAARASACDRRESEAQQRAPRARQMKRSRGGRGANKGAGRAAAEAEAVRALGSGGHFF